MRTIPESLTQAETWDKTRNHYARFGLCDRCAAQAAWGHTDGFSEVHPPCAGCAALIAGLPVARVNGWRSFRRGHTGDRTPAQKPQEPFLAVPQLLAAA